MTNLVEKQLQPSAGTDNRTPALQSASPTYTATTIQRSKGPKQPLFVGPTRSAYSFNIAETSLTRMGMGTNDAISTGPSSAIGSPDRSPASTLEAGSPLMAEDPMLNMSDDEAIRLVGIYEDEIACVHPIIETKDLIVIVPTILESLRKVDYDCTKLSIPDQREAFILKLALATALICERHGKNEVSDIIVASVERDGGNISGHGELNVKEVQIAGMLVNLSHCSLLIPLTIR